MIHLIGHSLGCHVAGIAGKRLFTEMGSRIGRISALDPAAPSYVNAPDEGLVNVTYGCRYRNRHFNTSSLVKR